MGAWGFVTLVSPLLHVFEIFHDEQELKKQKKKDLWPADSSLCQTSGALWPSGLLAVPQPQSPLSRVPASPGLVSSKGTVTYVSYFCYLFVC